MQMGLDTLKIEKCFVPSQDIFVLECTRLLRGRMSFTITFTAPSDKKTYIFNDRTQSRLYM